MTQEQFSFASEPQRHRRTDPVTSQIAGDTMIDSGKIGKQRQIVFDLVKSHPDSTSAEIARYGNMDRHIPGRRLTELVRLGLVEITGRRSCQTNGNLMQTYARKG